MRIYKLTFDSNLQSLKEMSYDYWDDYGIPFLQKSVRIADQWDPKAFAVRPISFSEFYMPQEHTKKEAQALFDRGLPDYIFSMESLFSQKAVDVLSPLLLPTGEFLPVEVSGTTKSVYAFHCIHLSDALDTRNSKFQSSSPGVISSFDEYVFIPDMLKNIYAFRLAADSLRTSLYVTEEVVSAVATHSLNGFKFKLAWSDSDDTSSTSVVNAAKQRRAAAPAGTPKRKTKAVGKVLSSDDCVMIRRSRINSGLALDVIDGNADVVRELFEGLVNENEISAEALLSVHVTRLFMEFQEGGCAQVVYNLLPDKGSMEKGIEGLKAIGAVKVSSAFQKALRDTKKIEPHVLDRFLKSMAFTRTAAFRSLSEHDAAIETALAKEDVLELHAEWLKARPGLHVLDDAEVDAQIALRINAIPDRAARL